MSSPEPISLNTGLDERQYRNVSPRGAETMQRALAVVEELLAEVGESGLRLSDVAERSGVSIGSLYHHFGSKEGLIAAARERQFLASLPEDAEAVTALIASASDPEAFVASVEALVRITQSPSRADNRASRVELLGAAMSRPNLLASMRAAQTAVFDVGEQIAMEFERAGLLREGVEPRAVASYVQAVTLGRILVDLDDHAVDEEAWVRIIVLSLRGFLTIPSED